MPQRRPMASNESKRTVPATPDAPRCPTCQRIMTVKQVTPSTAMIGIGKTVFVCDVCGAETHRAEKRP